MNKSRLAQFSLVIAADQNNPTILNPDFLVRVKVAEDSWKLAAPPLQVPDLAIVQYNNGITVKSLPDSFDIGDLKTLSPPDSHIREMMLNYIRAVKFVKYTGFGINFRSVTPTTDAKKLLAGKLLQAGPWSKENGMTEIGVKFVYPITSGKVIFSVDSGYVVDKKDDSKSSVILLSANFHRDLDQTADAIAQVESILNDNITTDWQQYKDFLSDIVGENNWKTI